MATPPTAITLGLHELELAHQAQIDAEIRQLTCLVQLAENYQVNEDCMMAVAVGERWVPGGADGTPEVGEFLANEVGPLLGVSAASAAGRIAEALNLRFRHPRLWDAVMEGSVRAWQAHRVTGACAMAGLDAAAADTVDRQVATALQMMPWTRMMRLLPAWIIRADPALAAERARNAAEQRYIHVGQIEDGHTDLWGRLSGADGIALDQALDLLADELLNLADTPETESPQPTPLADPLRLKETRRAKALGLMARAVLGQTSLFDDDQSEGCPTGLSALSVLANCAQTHAPRKADLLVHIDRTAAARPDTSVADVNGWGAVLATQLTALLSDSHVRVIPVIDTAALEATDSYSIPDRMRWALGVRNPVELFPCGTVDVIHCDIDHVVPYDHHNSVGTKQTRLDNLAPLGRRAHRAKTHGGWRLETVSPGWVRWETPAGRRYLVGPPGTFRLHDRLQPQWSNSTDTRGFTSAA